MNWKHCYRILRRRTKKAEKEAVDAAKMLMDRQGYCAQVESELAEIKTALKVSRLSVKEWQDREHRLRDKVYKPWSPNKKVIGFMICDRATGARPNGVGAEEVWDILTAIDRLLACREIGSLAIVPIFEGDIDKPKHVDEGDIEDGDMSLT